MRIIAIILTFNRLNLLKKTINSVLKQSRKIDAILIVNNGSKDNTLDFFTKNNKLRIIKKSLYLIKNYNNSKINLYLKNINENIGSAGGFNVGLRIAVDLNYDWFWLMDDDIEPYKETLETLLRYTSSQVNCIQGKRQFINGDEAPMGVELNSELGIIINKDIFKNLDRDYAEIKTGCWEGMLISKEVVKKIGYPDKDFYFYNDDAYYGFLASKVTMVLLVNKYLYKKNINANFFKIPFTKIKIFRPKSDIIYYYWIRNKFLLFELFKKNKTFKNIGYLLFLKEFIITLGAIIILDRSFKRFRYSILGLIDGIRGKFGKGFYKW